MNYRNTIQRDLVLEAARSLDHPTADEIYNKVTLAHPTVSRGTVYRNLASLIAQAKLRKVPLPSAADRYDITLRDHYHIRCRGCGRVVDADLPYQSELLDSIRDPQGFLLEDHDICFQGLCPDCQSVTGFTGAAEPIVIQG